MNVNVLCNKIEQKRKELKSLKKANEELNRKINSNIKCIDDEIVIQKDILRELKKIETDEIIIMNFDDGTITIDVNAGTVTADDGTGPKPVDTYEMSMNMIIKSYEYIKETQEAMKQYPEYAEQLREDEDYYKDWCNPNRNCEQCFRTNFKAMDITLFQCAQKKE